MGLLAINNTETTKAYNNDKVIYIKITGQEKSAQFKPSKAFENIVSNADVLKIITKGDIRPTKANDKGYVNFVLGNGTNQFGFINYLENSLGNDSTDDDKTEALFAVEAKLSQVTLDDISRPLTADEARNALDML